MSETNPSAFRRFRKDVLRSEAVRKAGCWLAAQYLKLVRATTRWETVNAHIPEAAWKGEKPVIVAFWHGRLSMMPFCWPSKQPFTYLSSAHPDGRLSAYMVKPFGISAVFGSPYKDGAKGLRQLVKLTKAGQSVGITPDGPRGPRMRASAGVIALARLSGVPILPSSVSTSGRWVLNSWDRLIIGKPFSRGAMVWEEPIYVPRDASEDEQERLLLLLEDRMNAACAKADQMVGQEVIQPAEAEHATA